MSVLIILALSAVVGGGVSVAAESSLPGDMLYGVKVSVNENVKTALSFGTEAQAKTQAELAIKRIEELERLAVKTKVSADVAAELQAKFQAHAETAAKLMAELDADSSYETSSEFETSLRSHRGVIARLLAQESDDANVLLSAASGIDAQTSSANTVKVSAETKFGADASVNNESRARGKLNAAQNKIREVKAYIDSRADLSAEAKAEAQAKVAAAEGLVVQGNARLEAKAYAEAFILFTQAHQAAQEAKTTVQSLLNVMIRIDSKADIDIQNQNTNQNNSGENSNNSDIDAEVEADVNAGSNNSGTNASGSGQIKVGL